ncbi:MAG: hypothetical protein HYW01_10910 [Deltaproteobacteria bacterium]|nr:hypothetical protein [Deltaproteobacteria bacterium]
MKEYLKRHDNEVEIFGYLSSLDNNIFVDEIKIIFNEDASRVNNKIYSLLNKLNNGKNFFITSNIDMGFQIESGIYVGRIPLKTLDHFTPDYDKEHIKSIVSYLYEVRDRETIDSANKICNIYGSRGFEFLRGIYEDSKNLQLDR